MNEPVAMSSADLDESDISAVLEVLRTGRLALGPRALDFERRVAEYVGVSHAVAVSSGTAALHLIAKALNLGPGDEVLLPSFTFAASVNSILYGGAAPVFVDIEPETFNLDPLDLERKVTRRTKAILAVDVFGHPAQWDELLRIASENHLHVIDDSCEALGAEYKGRRVGSFGDAAAFAFYPNKQITTGEGGIIVTDDENLARLARSLQNQGRHQMGAWLDHELLGYNYRLDEMSAALGVSQMKRIDTILEKRARVAGLYTELLKERDWVRPPVVKQHVRMSWFVYVVTLAEGLDRNRIVELMSQDGIPTRAYFSPMHQQPYLKDHPASCATELPVTEAYSKRTLALPFHNNLTEEQVGRVVESLRRAVES
jgi:perosamine synthetase